MSGGALFQGAKGIASEGWKPEGGVGLGEWRGGRFGWRESGCLGQQGLWRPLDLCEITGEPWRA